MARAERARLAVLAIWALLAATLLAWYLGTLPRAAAVVAIVLTVAPLAAPLPGIVGSAQLRILKKWGDAGCIALGSFIITTDLGIGAWSLFVICCL